MLSLAGLSLAQTPFTGDNHQQMMNQLGITKLRVGPSSDDSAVNHANYDEAKANPYPVWPDILTLKDGTKVTTAAQWRTQRRPQIVADFESEVYGRIPVVTPAVRWTALVSEKETISMRAVTATQFVGHVDNSLYPGVSVDIDMTLLLPTDADRHPVPVLIMFEPARFPAPRPPSEDEMKRLNAAAKAQLVERDPSLAKVFAAHPALDVVASSPRPIDPRIVDLIADGWGVALLNPTSVQPDSGAHELIALGAPRNVFISYGAPSGGDPTWLDQQGSYMAAVAAGAAWKLLGARDLGVSNDYKTAKMPPVLSGLTDGQLAWRQHDGGHTDAPNMGEFLKWADRQMGRTSPLRSAE